jgi:energy-coupling factor transporter ATP-binding protein EcfA2
MGISFEYRANANKAKGAPIDLVFPKEGLGWDLEAFAIHKGTKKLEAAKKLADWASSKDAMLLYGKNFAITAQPGVAAPLANVPKDYEARLVKMDFATMQPNRERVLAEWTKRYDSKTEQKKLSTRRNGPHGGHTLRPFFDASMTHDLFLELRNIRKAFGGFTALQDINLADPKRRICLFPGALGLRQDNACCASLPGWRCKHAGQVFQAGRDISRLPPAQRDYGIVFQSYALFPNLSVFDNVSYGLVNRKAPRAEIHQRVTDLVKLVGLPGSEAKYPGQLSGGQQQRIALARAWPPHRACCCWTNHCRRWTRWSASAAFRKFAACNKNWV